MFNTPILLITFNRPSHTRKILEVIRAQQPRQLYVFQDGARLNNEHDKNKCLEVRKIIDEVVDWRCDLKTYFSDINLGCGPGPYKAISWFFENVEYGIILEDDLDPHIYFFDYCEKMLTMYMNEPKVGLITGHNQHRIYTKKTSYYFTFNMSGTLGWATWRRVWKDFDFDIKYNREELDCALKEHYGLPRPYRDYENRLYKIWITDDRSDVWDHMFKYYLLLNGYLDVKPNSCLVSHLGTDADATHSGYTDPGYMMEINDSLFPNLIHPKDVKISSEEYKRIMIKSIKIIIKRFLRIIDY